MDQFDAEDQFNIEPDAGDAVVEACYCWQAYVNSKDPITQAAALIMLDVAMEGLKTWLPTYDYETGELGDWPLHQSEKED